MKMAVKYLVSASEMKQYDKNTIEKIGIPGLVLMERAALSVFQLIRDRGWLSPGGRSLILAGCGNNGGDGLALARLLCEAGMEVEVWTAGREEKATDSWKTQAEILQNYPIKWVNKPGADSYSIIIDALFGVGLSRPVEGEFEKALETVQCLKGWKIALDVPSGIDSDTGAVLGNAFRADVTVTFGFEKRGLYLFPGAEYAGEVVLRDVGISERAFLGHEPVMFYLDQKASELFPVRKRNGNKGTFGKALVVAGSFQMAGAAILCARAAYGSGAGMVRTLTCSDNRTIMQESVPEALLGALENEKDLRDGLSWCDVICIGPGLGQSERAKEVLRIILEESDRPTVVDADALNLLGGDRELGLALKKQGEQGRVLVLTPHLGELKRLYEGLSATMPELFDDPAETKGDFWKTPWLYAKQLARLFSVVVAAKDARTYVCDKEERICLNVSGNSGMATAGSGDVLAGLLTGFLCQGMEGFAGACQGVRLHGLAGDLAASRHGEHGMMAGDIVEALREFASK